MPTATERAGRERRKGAAGPQPVAWLAEMLIMHSTTTAAAAVVQ